MTEETFLSKLAMPLFDPDHPDAEILEAFEQLRTLRAWGYRRDIIDPAWVEDQPQQDRFDNEAREIERGIDGNWATTPTGIAAQLSLIATTECPRWVDVALSEDGIAALYHVRDHLTDHRDRELLRAMFGLVHMEWEQALAAYEKSAKNYAAALSLQHAVDDQRSRFAAGGFEAECVNALATKVAELEAQLRNNSELKRLMRTLTPDDDAFTRKVQILQDEGFEDGALPWIARDAKFIMARAIPTNSSVPV